MNSKYIAKDIVVVVNNLKSTEGKDIEIESRIAKEKTSEIEGDKDNNFHNTYVNIGDNKKAIR